MKYLGVVKQLDETLVMPDTFLDGESSDTYEAIQVGSDLLLLASPLSQERLQRIRNLVDQSISEHREALEGLAK
jgi:hypothetical protein